jgi:hypothetical protein
VGLAVVLALTAGLASTALAGTGVGGVFNLGQLNTVNTISRLVGNVNDSMLRLNNASTGASATALDLKVTSGKPPMTVNSDAKVTNLNADKLDGKDASQLPGTITDFTTFQGLVPTIVGNSGYYVFAGPSGSVTVADGQRLFGAAEAPLGLGSGPPQTADVGLCYQPNANGPITHFLGANFSVHNFTTTRAAYAATATTTLPAGEYTVGMCVRNNGPNTISNNNYVNGWVQVVNAPS